MTDKLARIWEEAIEVSTPEPEVVYPEIPEFEQDFCSFCATHPGAGKHPTSWDY